MFRANRRTGSVADASGGGGDGDAAHASVSLGISDTDEEAGNPDGPCMGLRAGIVLGDGLVAGEQARPRRATTIVVATRESEELIRGMSRPAVRVV